MYDSSAPLPDPGAEPGRRQALRMLASVLLACGPWAASAARAAPNEQLAFGAGSLEDVLRALDAAPAPNTAIRLNVPDRVENGAVVPVEVTIDMAGAQSLFLISEANPFPLVAQFVFPDGTEPYVSTRIKVARSCNVVALVRADGRFHSATKATQVIVGGCGA